MSGTYRDVDEAVALREEASVVAEHPNVGLIREAISTFNQGDFDAYREYFTEDIVWHVGGNHPLSGDYRGRDAISERDDKTLDVVLAEAMKVNAEGKVTEIWFLANDQSGYDHFWS